MLLIPCSDSTCALFQKWVDHINNRLCRNSKQTWSHNIHAHLTGVSQIVSKLPCTKHSKTWLLDKFWQFVSSFILRNIFHPSAQSSSFEINWNRLYLASLTTNILETTPIDKLIEKILNRRIDNGIDIICHS